MINKSVNVLCVCIGMHLHIQQGHIHAHIHCMIGSLILCILLWLSCTCVTEEYTNVEHLHTLVTIVLSD